MNDNPLLPGWAQKRLAELRRQLEEDAEIPAGIEALFADLNGLDNPPAADESELEQMLSLVIDDALNGIDIAQRYPDFYRQILLNEEIHRAFVEILETFSSDDMGPALQPSEGEGRLLQQAGTEPETRRTRPGQWRVQWQRTIQQLQSIFTTGGFAPGYRHDDMLEDDGWRTLLRSEVELDGMELDVQLEVQQPQSLESASVLALTLAQYRPVSHWPDIQADITWGDYQQTIPHLPEGRSNLPPLDPRLVLDESGLSFREDLRFELTISTSS